MRPNKRIRLPLQFYAFRILKFPCRLRSWLSKGPTYNLILKINNYTFISGYFEMEKGERLAERIHCPVKRLRHEFGINSWVSLE